ncbi:hypothetical protein KUTeg_005253 [Tegillarca granosa]|uniref:Uncharacterized protein n=1 Tax=Tegillarca granosa TaxID=220873 RepID=A0ABQ9FJ76_TEGGR|nr:hypothetical protein KUTeg_005253 [Tegillarca granosa]
MKAVFSDQVPSWEAYVPISLKAVEELKFWFDKVVKMNNEGSLLNIDTGEETVQVQIYCDASEIGYGGHLTIGSRYEFAHHYNLVEIWSVSEHTKSSTGRELETVFS